MHLMLDEHLCCRSRYLAGPADTSVQSSLEQAAQHPRWPAKQQGSSRTPQTRQQDDRDKDATTRTGGGHQLLRWFSEVEDQADEVGDLHPDRVSESSDVDGDADNVRKHERSGLQVRTSLIKEDAASTGWVGGWLLSHWVGVGLNLP